MTTCWPAEYGADGRAAPTGRHELLMQYTVMEIQLSSIIFYNIRGTCFLKYLFYVSMNECHILLALQDTHDLFLTMVISSQSET